MVKVIMYNGNMKNMQQLERLYTTLQSDTRISSVHVSLYMGFFFLWNLKHFQNPISITRRQMMQIAKIGGYATYHKCIKDLQAYGYIQYLPSYHPALGSLVYLNIFERNSRNST